MPRQVVAGGLPSSEVFPAMLANARLTEIRGPGLIDDDGETDLTGTVLWSGSAPGYLGRERGDVNVTRRGNDATSDGRESPRKIDRFTILTKVAPPLERAGASWDATTIVIEDRRSTPFVTRRFTVEGADHQMVGVLAGVDHTHLRLGREAS